MNALIGGDRNQLYHFRHFERMKLYDIETLHEQCSCMNACLDGILTAFLEKHLRR